MVNRLQTSPLQCLDDCGGLNRGPTPHSSRRHTYTTFLPASHVSETRDTSKIRGKGETRAIIETDTACMDRCLEALGCDYCDQHVLRTARPLHALEDVLTTRVFHSSLTLGGFIHPVFRLYFTGQVLPSCVEAPHKHYKYRPPPPPHPPCPQHCAHGFINAGRQWGPNTQTKRNGSQSQTPLESQCRSQRQQGQQAGATKGQQHTAPRSRLERQPSDET